MKKGKQIFVSLVVFIIALSSFFLRCWYRSNPWFFARSPTSTSPATNDSTERFKVTKILSSTTRKFSRTILSSRSWHSFRLRRKDLRTLCTPTSTSRESPYSRWVHLSQFWMLKVLTKPTDFLVHFRNLRSSWRSTRVRTWGKLSRTSSVSF